MLGALIIVFREVIEAGLIVGIVLAVTQGVHGSRLVIAAGVAAGVLGACLVAAFAGVIAEALAGIGQEIFNASILIVAVVMLIWHNVWMASHGRELAGQVKRVGDAVRAGRAVDRRPRRGLRGRGDARGLGGRAVHVWPRRVRRFDRIGSPDRLGARSCWLASA